MTNFNNLVPGGGLTAHERSGGHILTRHVGLTEAQLADRIANEGLRTTSSFTDRATAEEAIAEAIGANQSAIDSWLSVTPTRPLTVRSTASSAVGISLRRGAASVVSANRVLVVLNPDPSSTLGYYILTAYIQP